MERKGAIRQRSEYRDLLKPAITGEIADRMHKEIDQLPNEFMARITLYEYGNPNPSAEELASRIEGVEEYKKLMHRVFDVLAGREIPPRK